MIKKVLLGTLLLVVLVCAGGALFLYNAVNADIDEHFAGTCVDVPLVGSAEDTQVDRDRGLAYMSMLDRLGVAQGIEVDPGMVMRVDLTQSPLRAEPALQGGPDLRPHGLSLFVDDQGQRYLFVINHPRDRESGAEAIERYVEQKPGVFVHAESYASPLITRANDMVAVGPNQFYVVQDVDRTSGESFTSLIFYDGEDYKVVADDIESGGGINVSADGSTLYIAETGGKRIRIVKRNPADGSITTLRNIQLDTSPDNIDVAADGSLWVGAHSNVIALAMHFIMGANAPSQILRIDVANETPAIEEIYLNAGDQISAGSGGTTYENKLLIGSITARKLLVCEMET